VCLGRRPCLRRHGTRQIRLEVFRLQAGHRNARQGRAELSSTRSHRVAVPSGILTAVTTPWFSMKSRRFHSSLWSNDPRRRLPKALRPQHTDLPRGKPQPVSRLPSIADEKDNTTSVPRRQTLRTFHRALAVFRPQGNGWFSLLLGPKDPPSRVKASRQEFHSTLAYEGLSPAALGGVS
jgi:hypothetical protein